MLSTHSRSVYYFIICYCEIFGQEQAIDHAFYISWEQFLRTKPTRGTALAKFYRCLAIDCRKTLTCTYITELALPCFDANLPAGKHEYRACSSKKYLAAKYTPSVLQSITFDKIYIVAYCKSKELYNLCCRSFLWWLRNDMSSNCYLYMNSRSILITIAFLRWAVILSNNKSLFYL